MSKSQRLEDVLVQAKEKEKKYDWLEAAKAYEQALGMVKKDDFLRKGEVQEKIGYCFQHVAFQAETQEEFKQWMQQAIEAYEETKRFCRNLAVEQKDARIFRCDSMIAFIGYWLASEASEKKRLLDECWKLTKESLKAFKEGGDEWEYGKTYNQLSTSAVFRFCLEWSFQAREKMVGEAIERGEQAIKFLSDFGDRCELAKAYARTAFYLAVFSYHCLDIGEKERDYPKVQDYWTKARELSEEIALFELLYPIFGGQIVLWGEASDEAMTNLKKALEYGRKTKDKFLIGCALDWLVYHNAWHATTIEDPEERSKALETFLQYAEDARQQYSVISFTSPRGDFVWVEMAQASVYWFMAFFETNLKKKRGLYEEARKIAQDKFEPAKVSAYPEIISYVDQRRSGILRGLAMIETSSKEKKRLLEKAMEYANEAVRIHEQIAPFLYWDRGAQQTALAEIKYGLADLEKDFEAKRNMLREAILDIEKGLKLCAEEILLWARKTEFLFAPFGYRQYGMGVWLNRLFELTGNKEHLSKAAEAFAEAAESYKKVDLKSRIAECHWKAAQTYDASGKYLKAAESFSVASNNYKSAAEKIPQLKDFYQDHARYMQAWSEIEKARHQHENRQYGLAKEHYEKATDLHKSAKRWSYLSSNYLALARFEEAEDMSRREQIREAKDLFQQAAKLFVEAKASIDAKLERIEARDEKEMAAKLGEASDIRREYCLSRILLEEAKILDRQGDHAASSRKYGAAAEKFQKAIDATVSESDRQESRPIVYLSKAWQAMTRAEAQASPELYLEASNLFDEAKEHSSSEKEKMLALGHSRFCKALEAGTRFEATGDMEFHSRARKNLEAAARYYVRAGFKTASEYAKATHRLFDAYMYMSKADTETDPKKKAQLYQMAEKLLKASAGSYMKARHPEKSEEVQRLLESVKEERQLATSLTEVLHAPTITSTTSSFSTPTPTQEQAVGLERFEHADIQANLIFRVKEAKVGEDISFRVEMVNAGKAPALLVKVDETVPESFEIKEVPEIYTVEDSYINMKGKRLNPLKTEDVKVVVTPQSKGTYILKPRILYLDETGKYKSHEPEPVTIIVKELGIKGWIKGEK